MIRSFTCLFIPSILFVLLNKIIAQPVTDSFSSYNQSIPGTEIKFKMVPVSGGSFIMGSDTKEKGREPDEGPAKEVSVSSFWMGANEVTYDEYDAFFKDETFTRNQTTDAITRPSPPYIDLTLGMGRQGGFPANSMSQYGALMFCRWLYKKQVFLPSANRSRVGICKQSRKQNSLSLWK
ncbi:MAG: SUMF1/EgtB/PvdO family nonheme iron enzyme [Segetibacter sp.]